MAALDEHARTIDLRAYRDLATARLKRQPFRFLFFFAAAVLSAGFVDAGWGLLALAAIAAVELAERNAAKAFLAASGSDGVDPWGTLAKRLVAANVATAVAVSFGLAVIIAFADGPPQAVALLFLAVIVLSVSVDTNQVLALTIARQSILLGTGLAAMSVRTVQDDAHGLWESALPLIALGIFAIVALAMSFRSAAGYRESLGREIELARARDAAERADRVKGALLATVSHELRTPLNGMLGMTQTLLQSDLAPGQRAQLEVVADSGRALNALLTDILDYSKLEAGKLSIRPAEDDLRRTVDEVARLYGPVAEKKGLELAVQFSPQIPARMVFDAVRVRQCLSNLVSNAVKFTEDGRVSVAIDAVPANPSPGGAPQRMVRMIVRDTGIGIPADRQPHLFQPFSQADFSIAPRYGGTGLGLSITRQLAESMGGTVSLNSVFGKGAEFRLTFLAGLTGEALEAGAPAAAGDLAGRRVLIVDAAESNRMVMRLFLEPLGIQVAEAADTGEATAALQNGAIDAALLDLHLPGQDTAAIAEAVRHGRAGQPDIPLIAITTDGSGKAVPLGPDGFDASIRKPVDHRQLQSVLRAAIQRRAGHSGPAADEPGSTGA